MKKYKFTEETIYVDGRTLYRIEALKDFSDVKKGNKGGFIENESNLSQRGDCWVYNDAMVCGNARVFGDAKVYEFAIVQGNAQVYGHASVRGNAEIYDNAEICGNADVYGNAKIYGNARVYDYAEVYDNAEVLGNAKVFENAEVSFDAKVYDDAKVYEYAMVQGNAKVYGNAEIRTNACIYGDAVIDSIGDYIVFKNFWSSGRSFTWTRSNDMWKVGCFYGTGEELIKKAYKESEISGREYERIVKYVETIKGK